MNPELEQKIRERAYEIWEYRMGCGMFYRLEKHELRDITAQDDWLEAEEEVKHAQKFHNKFDIK